MEAFVQIHQAGVEHFDVDEHHVLVNEAGRVSIIDFQEAVRIRCGLSRRIPQFREFGPNMRGTFGCDELWGLGWRLRLWIARTCINFVRGFHFCDVLIFVSRTALWVQNY